MLLLSVFTFRNKTQFGVFFWLQSEEMLLLSNLTHFPKEEVFHGQREHEPKHTLYMPCQQLHLKETSSQIPHQQGWRKSGWTGANTASVCILPPPPPPCARYSRAPLVRLIDAVG